MCLCLVLGACSGSDSAGNSSIGSDARLGPGSFTKNTYVADSAPQWDYYVYIPSNLPAGAVPLVVYLHGCEQTATDAALGTLWNQAAEEHGFIVVYPEQRLSSASDATGNPTDGNGGRCWNWFVPEDQQRGAGEPATIAGITQTVMAAHAVDPMRVYVIGVSAGAGMSSIMGATYPDLYAAIGIVAGVPYGGGDLSGAQAAQAMGAHERVMPVFVMHGTADEVAAFPLGVAAVQQWLGTDDLVDDGSADNSISRMPASTETHGLDPSVIAGVGNIGDLCITPPLALPCLGAAAGLDAYPYSVLHYADRAGQPLLDFWIIYGAGHTYVGGSRNGSFTDPLGPSTTNAAYDFFMAHPRTSP